MKQASACDDPFRQQRASDIIVLTDSDSECRNRDLPLGRYMLGNFVKRLGDPVLTEHTRERVYEIPLSAAPRDWWLDNFRRAQPQLGERSPICVRFVGDRLEFHSEPEEVAACLELIDGWIAEANR